MKYNKKEELEKAAKDLLKLKESINLLDLVINSAALEDVDSLVLQGIVKKYNKVLNKKKQSARPLYWGGFSFVPYFFFFCELFNWYCIKKFIS